jgi:NitT/TauT family transport system substrate-binding protein
VKLKFLVIIVAVSSIMSGCARTQKGPIKIGVNDWPPCEVWTIAQQNGYFSGIDVEIVRFTNWSDNMNSMYFGTTDITYATYFNSIYLSDKGERAKLLMPIDTIVGGDGLVVSGDIDDISELKGKKIAVEIGTDEHFLLSKSLESANLTLEDVELISSTSKESIELLNGGEVSGAFTYEPYLSKGANEYGGNILFTTKELPNHRVNVLVARESSLNDRKDDYKIIVEAWYKALEYIEKNPKESFEIMAKNENMDPEVFGKFYSEFKFYSKEEANKQLESSELEKLLNSMNEFCEKYHLINEKVDVKELLDVKVLEGIRYED